MPSHRRSLLKLGRKLLGPPGPFRRIGARFDRELVCKLLLQTSAEIEHLFAARRIPAANDAFGRAGWVGAAREHAATVGAINQPRQLVQVAADQLRALLPRLGVPDPRGIV